MHRSGTSFVAELFRMGGVFIGDQLFPADEGNPRGYFEDVDFLTLQRGMLIEACAPGATGWPDWGWTEEGTLREKVWDTYEPAMRELAASRSAVHDVWGWKDPRTTLLMAQWLRVLPDARFVFVIREPWAVAESVRRLPAEIFQTRPDVAVRIWMFYNQHLLDFARVHPERCAILPTPWLNNQPHVLLNRVSARLGLTMLHHDAVACGEVVKAAQARARTHPSGAESTFRVSYARAYDLWQELLRRSGT